MAQFRPLPRHSVKILTSFTASLLLFAPAAYAGSSDEYAYAKVLQICILAFGRNENIANPALSHFNGIYGPTIFEAFATDPSMEDRIIKKIEDMGYYGEWIKLVEQTKNYRLPI